MEGHTPVISIAKFTPHKGERETSRIIAIGELGAETNRVEQTSDEFCGKLIRLGDLATRVVKSIYELNNDQNPLRRDLTLYLDCII